MTVDRESVDIYTANERSWLQPCTSEAIISLAKIQVLQLSVTDESIRILSTNEPFQSSLSMSSLIRASTREKLSSGVVNNKDADQPAHPRRLISAFVIRFL